MDRRDRVGVAVLLLLYFLQGVPFGMVTISLPYILADRATMTQLGVLSMASLPYSFKLLLSPIVDLVFFPAVGRRKTWTMLPSAVVGVFLLGVASTLQHIVYDSTGTVDMTTLGGSMTLVILLMAAQDVGTDAMALEILSPANIAFASTSQTVGMTLGNIAGSVLLIGMCYFDKSLFQTFVHGMGLLCIATAAVVWQWVDERPLLLFLPMGDAMGDAMGALDDQHGPIQHGQVAHSKGTRTTRGGGHNNNRKEGQRGGGGGATSSPPAPPSPSLRAAFAQLQALVTRPAFRTMAIALCIARVGYIHVDTVTRVLFLNSGLDLPTLGMVFVLQVPVQALVSVLTANAITAGRPLWPLWLHGNVAMLVAGLPLPFLLSTLKSTPVGSTAYSLLVLVTTLCLSALTAGEKVMSTCSNTYFNLVSDPRLGGTYLAVFNTFANFGWAWPKPIAYTLTDLIGHQNAVFALAVVGAVILTQLPALLSSLQAMQNEKTAWGWAAAGAQGPLKLQEV